MYHVCDVEFLVYCYLQKNCVMLYTMSFEQCKFPTFFILVDLRNKVCQNMRLYETKRKERDTGCFQIMVKL